MCGFVFYSGKDLEKEKFEKALEKINHRGPDDTEVETIDGMWMGFKRLAIIDPTHAGDQPFQHKKVSIVCNGEIYNYKELKKVFSEYSYISGSDCEVLMPIFKEEGIEGIVKRVDAEYAVVIYDEESKSTFAARDEIGIRPLFYGYTKKGEIVFGSEVKAIQELCTDIFPFPPGHFYKDGKFFEYSDLGHVDKFVTDTHPEIYKNIKDKLVAGVKKRMQADVPMGYLLSGGLDSSLVCSIAQRHSDTPIKTFAIGMSEDAIDLKYAKEVADFIGSDHTEVIIKKDDVIGAIKDVVYHLESWDITTVRASVGMYLICKWIKENTDVKVLMTGEVSDEIFGYKYTDFAPSGFEFQKEAAKRLRELYIYDVLRADRCISAHSIEARVPFSDKDFVSYVMSIDPEKKMNTYGHGKYILRAAFEGDYLPHSILFREKAAFSDAVGHSLVDFIKAYAEEVYDDQELNKAEFKYKHVAPFTKESLLFRDIFESFYPKKGKLITDYWMPNNEWENCDVKDPSARVLPNYGASGE
jgi:asparagine synthase (glutamine-hydrolysing)